MIQQKPLFDGGHFIIDFLADTTEGFTVHTRNSLLRHAPNTPLPGAKRICSEKEQRKFRIGPGFTPKIGIRNPKHIGHALICDIQAVTYPAYSAIGSINDPQEELAIANPGATATILFTSELDGRHKMLVQHRSRHNRFYPETIGASAAGFLDGKLDKGSRGRLLPIDENTVKASALKEMTEEIQVTPSDIDSLRITGLSQDRVKVHSEFLLMGLLKVSELDIKQRVEYSSPGQNDHANDFAEKFFVIDGSLDAIATLITEVKCPLPPTHVAAFVAAGYIRVLEVAGLEAAIAWRNNLELRVRKNCQSIDQMVANFWERQASIPHVLPNSSTHKCSGYNPAISPTAQGLPDVVSELKRVSLLSELSI